MYLISMILQYMSSNIVCTLYPLQASSLHLLAPTTRAWFRMATPCTHPSTTSPTSDSTVLARSWGSTRGCTMVGDSLMSGLTTRTYSSSMAPLLPMASWRGFSPSLRVLLGPLLCTAKVGTHCDTYIYSYQIRVPTWYNYVLWNQGRSVKSASIVVGPSTYSVGSI